MTLTGIIQPYYSGFRLISDPRTGVLKCERCGEEVVDEEVMSSADAAELYKKMNQTLKPVVSLLKEIETGPPIQMFDARKYLSAKPAEKYIHLPLREAEKDLEVLQEQTVLIEDKSPQLPSQAEPPMIRNYTMPEWISKSTVSGHEIKQRLSPSMTSPQTTISQPTMITEAYVSRKHPMMPEVAEGAAIEAESQPETRETKKPRVEAAKEEMTPPVEIKVTVAGKPVPLFSVTEADKARMTLEESEKYYEEFVKIFGENI